MLKLTKNKLEPSLIPRQLNRGKREYNIINFLKSIFSSIIILETSKPPIGDAKLVSFSQSIGKKKLVSFENCDANPINLVVLWPEYSFSYY